MGPLLIDLVNYSFYHWRASMETPLSYPRRALGAEENCQTIKMRQLS